MLYNIYSLSAESIQEMLQEIRAWTTELFSMLESVALLDMLLR